MKLCDFMRCCVVTQLWVAGFLASNVPQATSAATRKHDTRSTKAVPETSKATPPYSPIPLSSARRNTALQIFERVHPILTIHYHGFSKNGSLICYDMLTELRTVEEARSMVDVEFYLLDQMLEHYQVRQHVRIVDVSVVRSMLNLGNLMPWRVLQTVSNILRFVSDYEPILRVFLKRYLPHIEMLVLVNVPALLVPLMPAILSRTRGVPSRKIAAVANGSDLERFMDRKYIPKEFGNPKGLSVKNSDENITAWCLMLRDIVANLGDDAISPEGKNVLKKHGARLLGSALHLKESHVPSVASKLSVGGQSSPSSQNGQNTKPEDADLAKHDEDVRIYGSGEAFDDID